MTTHAPVEHEKTSDERAVELARRGDELGFSALERRHAPALRRLAMSVLHDAYAAEDVVRSTFVLAARHLDQLPDAARVGGWLISICAREALTQVRAGGSGFALDADVGRALTPRRDRPEDAALANERLDAVLQAAEGLSRDDQALVRLYLQGLEGAALAGALVGSRARKRPQACPEFENLLATEGGGFGPVLRRRIVGHVGSCAGCQARLRRLVDAPSLLAVLALLGAPAQLRARAARTEGEPRATAVGTGARPPAARHRHGGGRRVGGAALSATLLLASVTAGVAAAALTSSVGGSGRTLPPGTASLSPLTTAGGAGVPGAGPTGPATGGPGAAPTGAGPAEGPTAAGPSAGPVVGSSPAGPSPSTRSGTAPGGSPGASPAPTTPSPTEPSPTEPSPTEPSPTTPAPTTPVPTKPVPTKPAPTQPIPGPAGAERGR